MRYLAIVVVLLISNLSNAGNIYVSMSGSDSNGGDYESPLRTLQKAVGLSFVGDTIVVNSGVYQCETVVIETDNITIESISNERPVFLGCGIDIFIHVKADGFSMENIRIENYKTAIKYYGDRNNFENNVSTSSLYGLYMKNIGYESGGAVVLVNADNVSIENSHFMNSGNINSPASFHAIYLAHGSSNNYIARNRFVGVSGDPIRVRDLSNYNLIENNTFEDSGYYATFSDWYCTGSSCTKLEPECRSYGNVFRYNDVDFTAFSKWGSDTSCGSLPSPWLRTLGNY